MMFKNLTDNAKNLAANAKIEDMSRLFKNSMTGKQDVKNALSGVMDISKEVSFLQQKEFSWDTNQHVHFPITATQYITS